MVEAGQEVGRAAAGEADRDPVVIGSELVGGGGKGFVSSRACMRARLRAEGGMLQEPVST